MVRLTAEGVALFFVPFLIYGALLLLARRWPWLRRLGLGGQGLLVAICGAGLVVLGLLALGAFSGRQGAYVPARIEGGRLVPGHIE